DQKHGRVSDYRSERHNPDEHVSPTFNVRVLQRHGERLRLLGCELLLQHIERHDSDEHRSNKNVNDRGDYKRSDDADRQISRGTPRLLCNSRDRVETNISEKYDRSARLDSDPAVRQKRMEIIGLHVRPSNSNTESQDNQLHDHHRGIHRRALSNAKDEDNRDQRNNAERENVEDDRYSENVWRILEQAGDSCGRAVIRG